MINLKDLQHDTESYLSNTADFLKDEFDENPDLFKILGGVVVGIAIGAIAMLLLSPKNPADRRKMVGNSPKGF